MRAGKLWTHRMSSTASSSQERTLAYISSSGKRGKEWEVMITSRQVTSLHLSNGISRPRPCGEMRLFSWVSGSMVVCDVVSSLTIWEPATYYSPSMIYSSIVFITFAAFAIFSVAHDLKRLKHYWKNFVQIFIFSNSKTSYSRWN
jgi:hypothetical protein